MLKIIILQRISKIQLSLPIVILLMELLFSNEEKNDERIEILNTLNIPFVVFGMSYNTSVSFVANDNYTSCKSAAHELIRSGINSCHILIANKIPTNIERKNGVIDAFSEAGLDNIKVFYDITCASDAYALVSSDISNHRLPDLYFVSGDDKAIGVIKALNDGNIKFLNAHQSLDMMTFLLLNFCLLA